MAIWRDMRMMILDEAMTHCIVMRRMAMRVFGGDMDMETSPHVALGLIGQRPYDLIVSGYRMGGMDALQFVDLVRALDEHRRTPIIITSACLEPSVRARLMTRGVESFIARPIDADRFREVIHYYLSIRPNAFAA